MANAIFVKYDVVPLLDAPIEHSLPLLHFDMKYLAWRPQKHLAFYEIPKCSKSQFLENFVPQLKTSLSLTLKHFLPYAGNILVPLASSGRPICKYADGDSVCLTIAESGGDFVHLAGYHSRNAEELYYLAPEALKPHSSTEFMTIPSLAVQVTFFPDQGICIGFTHHHAIGDAATFVNFLQSWASVNNFNGEAYLLEKHIPFYDRSSLEDPDGLDDTCWNQVKTVMFMTGVPLPWATHLPVNKVQQTFVYSKDDIQKLKNVVTEKKPDIKETVSSFTVVIAHVWSCLAKSAAAIGEEVSEREPEHLTAAANVRARLDPPLPANYFGNCLARVKAELSHGRAKGDDGFVNAAMVVRQAVQATLNNDKGLLSNADTEVPELLNLLGKRWLKVSGSPRYDVYAADYGWGRPKKFEDLCTEDVMIFLCNSREFEGGIEVGLPLSKIKMDAYETIFKDTLNLNYPTTVDTMS